MQPGSGRDTDRTMDEDHNPDEIELEDTTERDFVEEDAGEPLLVLIAHPAGRVLGKRHQLTPGTTIEVGRAPECKLDFPDVPSLSRIHARIGYHDDGVWVEDQGSTNGSFVNHWRIKRRRTLESGDRLQFGEVHFKFLRELDVEAAYFDTLHQLALQDGLTEVANKRRFDDELEREFARARRHDRQLSLILFDVDDFKQINDEHGHLTGDYVLQEIARVADRHMRREEILARLGGDEFGILSPEVGVDGAATLAERLRANIEEHLFDAEFISSPPEVTCSFGVAELTDDMTTAERLFAAADSALYDSKTAGRNRVTVHVS
jgi:diguanylate cyclase (GGDEF)-like protein